jgi:hypothetical protein
VEREIGAFASCEEQRRDKNWVQPLISGRLRRANMPLSRDSSRATVDFEGFSFSMHSGSDVVAVLVTPETVQELSSSAEASLEQLAQYRIVLESIASAKYHRRATIGSRITVWSADVARSSQGSATDSSSTP